MTARKTKGDSHAEIDPSILADLFPDSDYNRGECFGELESPALTRLIRAVTGLGGMVTFYCDSHNRVDSISLRFGERKAGFELQPGGPNDILIEQLANKYLAALAKYKSSNTASK